MTRQLCIWLMVSLSLGFSGCGEPSTEVGNNSASEPAPSPTETTKKTSSKSVELDKKIKSKIARDMEACIGSVTALPGADPISDVQEQRDRQASYVQTAQDIGLGEFDKASRNKRWSVQHKPATIVTMGMTLGDVSYECDYRQVENSEDWTLTSAKRNNQEAYNRQEHLSIKAQNTKDYVATWRERDYQNADYKFYEKLYESYNGNLAKGPSLRISCNPENMQVLYIRENVSRAETDYPFTFVTADGPQDRLVDLNSRGSLSLQSEKAADGSSTQLGTLGFLKLMVDTKMIKVDGFEFKMDDLAQVPCLFLDIEDDPQ